MLHLGIVCNVLRSIGERPLISPPDANIPVFPGQMPGLDLSDVLTGDIALEPFSTFGMDRFNRINLFMRIEEPEGGDIDPRRRASLTAASAPIPKFRTIGEFYDVIAQGIETLGSSGAITFGGGNQVTSDYSAFSDLIEVRMKPDAIRLIRLIQQQGEGTGNTQASGSGVNELAHYYAFKQIVEEKQYNWSTGSPILDAGMPLPFPTQDQVRQFTPPPVGGNSESAAFDATYSQMLDSLQYAWDGHPESLDNDAVNSMSDMSGKAITLMDSGFGPNFFYVPTSVRGQARRAISIRSSEKVGAQSKTASMSASTKRNASMQALATDIFEPADRQPIKFPQGAVNLLTSAVLIPGYARIREILDGAVNGTTFGAHGPFWR